MDLEDARRAAQDAARASKWDEVADLEPHLRTDADMWVDFWAPLCAIAAQMTGRPDDGRRILDEAIAAGFFQPELFGPELGNAFGDDPDWPALQAAIAANTPPPPILLTRWPTIRPTTPYTLFRLTPDREALLRERIPAPKETAWETAQTMLAWVTDRWVHSSEHTEPDALVILASVDIGARFACLEYATVLSQALNAISIPCRRVGLRTATAHAGIGGGHVVAEAWIGELDRWVVLDGQNGLYWTGEDGTPLGAVELQERFHAGAPRPPAVCVSKELTDEALAGWWSYFATAACNDVAWGVPGYAPYFEGEASSSEVLLASPAQAYPDFAELAVKILVVDGAPAVQPMPAHPFATGYRVIDSSTSIDLPLDRPWPLPGNVPGEREVGIATLTPYGTLRPSPLAFTVA